MEGVQVWDKQHPLSLEKCPKHTSEPLEQHCETHHQEFGTLWPKPGLSQSSWYGKPPASRGCLEGDFGCGLTDSAACSPGGFGDHVNRQQRNVHEHPKNQPTIWSPPCIMGCYSISQSQLLPRYPSLTQRRAAEGIQTCRRPLWALQCWSAFSSFVRTSNPDWHCVITCLYYRIVLIVGQGGCYISEIRLDLSGKICMYSSTLLQLIFLVGR